MDRTLSRPYVATRARRNWLQLLQVLQRLQRNYRTRQQLAQLDDRQLADVGIEVEINAPDRSAVGAIRVGGNWDIYMARFNVPRPDPVQIYDFHYGRNAGQNFSLIEGDEELFAAVDAGRTTLDREERRRHYLEVQNILIDKSYYAFLLFREARHVARTSLRNLAVDGGGVWNLAEVWLD